MFRALHGALCGRWREPGGVWDLPGGPIVKNPPASAGDAGSIPDLGRSPEGKIATHSSILPGKSRGQRSLVGYSPWGRKESDSTNQLTHIHTDINEKIKYQFIQGPTPVILSLLF